MPQLLAPLQLILAAELAAGNAIQERSAWLPACELLIILRHKFTQAYPVAPGLTYRLLNDAHYWYAEYACKGGRQVLACGFS